MSASVITIGIIGPTENEKYINTEFFEKMIIKVYDYITTIMKQYSNCQVQLISGGASWADHVAVEIFKRVHITKKLVFPLSIVGLVLSLPCPFSNGQFYDNGKYAWKVNPGRLANIKHQNFSMIIGRNTLLDITDVIQSENCKVEVYDGFLARNTRIANCDILFTFSSQNGEPTSGGTFDTWKKRRGTGIVCPLNTM